METVIEARDIPFAKETKPVDTINPVAPKLIGKPKIHTNLSKTSSNGSPNEKRSVGFIIPEGFDNSRDGLGLVVTDDDSTVVSTPIDEFFLDSPTSSSLDISVRELHSDILVALFDREAEIKDLFVRNQDYFDFVKQSAFSSDDRWQEFLNILFSPRKQISDTDWMDTISELLSPPLLVQFKVIVGYYDNDEENDNVDDENDFDDSSSVYTCDSQFGNLDIASIRDYPKSLEYLEISYPQFFANARQILGKEKQRKGSFLGGNHLTDDIPLQSENDVMPEPTSSLYVEFKKILLCPRSEMDDVEWDISIYELLDPWPQLVAQFEDIIAHEISGANRKSSQENIVHRGDPVSHMDKGSVSTKNCSPSVSIVTLNPTINSKLYNINWKEIGKLLLGGGDGIFVWWISQSNERRINETMKNGTRPQLIVSDDEYVPRHKDIERLKVKNHAYYHVVCGEHGTGKTTLVRVVANEVGKGVIYINFPENFNKLGDEFGKALNLTFEEDASLTVQLLRKFFGWNKGDEFKNSYSKWERAMDVIKHASENPKILEILQDGAKMNADDRKYIAVFVSSEGSPPRIMQSRSAWSRVKRPMEIGDLTEKESLDYLVNKRGIKTVREDMIDTTEAKRIYELVGGRIMDLKSVADEFLKENDFEDIKKELFIKVENKFRIAKLLKNYEHHEVGKHVIKALLSSKELSRIEYENFFKKPEDADKVLESNVFAYHPEKNTVTFQSQSVECYVQENADIFLKQ
ncbi:12459_t:CDS:2 [Dentiscutata erythropus]|uniref:12459_t:CDS:1 n=1 Tax=Dentiscutata erythropus TaxID=1348616 RepID=A0A9N8Z2Q4_9GLOM|nr:12459_t:CDS:2 [Dentiscutata erythropus]